MRGISWFVDILRDRSKLLRLKLTNLFPNINFPGEKDSGKVLIIIIILFLIIITTSFITIAFYCLTSPKFGRKLKPSQNRRSSWSRSELIRSCMESIQPRLDS